MTAPLRPPGIAALPVPPPLAPEIARALADHVARASGIRLDASKTDFIAFHVGRRLRELGLPDYGAYLALLESDPTGTELRHTVETLTTHTTSFFREARQYEWLAETGLDSLGNTGNLVVWSAAASIGAELWSAAMLLAERAAAGRPPAQWSLLGTDISGRVLARARQAIYSEEEIAGLSPARRDRFLMRSRRLRDGRGRPLWRVVPELRSRARFERANLQELSALPDFTADIAF